MKKTIIISLIFAILPGVTFAAKGAAAKAAPAPAVSGKQKKDLGYEEGYGIVGAPGQVMPSGAPAIRQLQRPPIPARGAGPLGQQIGYRQQPSYPARQNAVNQLPYRGPIAGQPSIPAGQQIVGQPPYRGQIINKPSYQIPGTVGQPIKNQPAAARPILSKPLATSTVPSAMQRPMVKQITPQMKTTIAHAKQSASQKNVVARAQTVAQKAANANTPGGAKAKQATSAWAKKSTWQQKGGWTGKPIAQAKNNINQQGGIKISGKVINPITNAPWIHFKGAWSPCRSAGAIGGVIGLCMSLGQFGLPGSIRNGGEIYLYGTNSLG